MRRTGRKIVPFGGARRVAGRGGAGGSGPTSGRRSSGSWPSRVVVGGLRGAGAGGGRLALGDAGDDAGLPGVAGGRRGHGGPRLPGKRDGPGADRRLRHAGALLAGLRGGAGGGGAGEAGAGDLGLARDLDRGGVPRARPLRADAGGHAAERAAGGAGHGRGRATGGGTSGTCAGAGAPEGEPARSGRPVSGSVALPSGSADFDRWRNRHAACASPGRRAGATARAPAHRYQRPVRPVPRRLPRARVQATSRRDAVRRQGRFGSLPHRGDEAVARIS